MSKITQEVLPFIGLSAFEGKVYLATLELGSASLQAISRKSGVNRSTIYTFIEDLKERGYMRETRKGKRKVYTATHPEHLVSIEEARLERLRAVLPELIAIDNKSSGKPRVTFYEGFDGIEEVYTDMLRTKKEIVAFEDLESLHTYLPKRIYDWFPAERARKDILIRSVSLDTPFAREFTKSNRRLLRETRFLKAALFKTDINIYSDKVALIDLKGTAPFAVLIENSNLAQTLRSIFETTWGTLGDTVE